MHERADFFVAANAELTHAHVAADAFVRRIFPTPSPDEFVRTCVIYFVVGAALSVFT